MADAAVVGVVLEGEELPRAYVVLKEGRAARTEDIARFVEGRVARFKRLTGGVVFTNVIPKNPVRLAFIPLYFECLKADVLIMEQSGKILRRILRERANEEVRGGPAQSAKL